jgi:cobalt-zinc-cadmium efflux system membrane fusion protein
VLAAVLVAVPIACQSGKEPAGGKEPAEKAGRPNAAKGPVEITLTPEAVARHGVKVEEAQARVLVPTFVAPGEVAFDTERMSYVGCPVTGRVADTRARVGRAVRKGDELLVIDSPEYAAAQTDHLQKEAAVAAAGPLVEVARSAYDRAKQLSEDKVPSVTVTELQKREGEYRTAEGNLKQARAAAVASRNRLRTLGMGDEAIRKLEAGGPVDPRFVIRSPIAGEVVDRPVTLGELVRPEKESLITIADLSVVWVLADVPEARVKGLLGAAARIKVGDAGPALAGVVSYVPPRLDTATRTARVRIEVRNEHGELRAGTFTQVEIAAGKPDPDARPVVAVPDEAVLTIDNAPCVFVPVAGKENTFVRKAVALGAAAGGFVAVEAGLKAGQPFVSAGAFVLKAELGKSALED